MKCQILFSRKNKKNINNLLSTDSAHSMVSVKAIIATTADSDFFIFLFYFSEEISIDI